MATSGKRPYRRTIAGIVFLVAGGILMVAVRPAAGVGLVVVGGVLMAAGVAAARKAAERPPTTPDDRVGTPPAP